HDIGLDTLLTVGSTPGGIEFRRRELQSRPRRTELEDALHGAFSIASFSDHHGAAVVLQGAGKDLTGARTVVVDQYVERHLPDCTRAGTIDLGLVGCTAPSRDDDALVDELLRDFHRDVQEPAGVTPEVDHERPHTQAAKGRYILLEFFG